MSVFTYCYSSIFTFYCVNCLCLILCQCQLNNSQDFVMYHTLMSRIFIRAVSSSLWNSPIFTPMPNLRRSIFLLLSLLLDDACIILSNSLEKICLTAYSPVFSQWNKSSLYILCFTSTFPYSNYTAYVIIFLTD